MNTDPAQTGEGVERAEYSFQNREGAAARTPSQVPDLKKMASIEVVGDYDDLKRLATMLKELKQS